MIRDVYSSSRTHSAITYREMLIMIRLSQTLRQQLKNVILISKRLHGQNKINKTPCGAFGLRRGDSGRKEFVS